MILAPTPLNTPQPKTLDFRIKYKTQKCRYLIQKGYCPYSSSCTFAHSELQVRSKIHIPLNYKTKLCINFSAKGFCLYGDRCQYIHISPEQSDKDEDGRQTRSNSEESNCSKTSKSSKAGNKLWLNFSHTKKVELIQTLGLDFTIRSSSRLMQLLNSNEDENEYSPELFGQNMTDKGRENIQKNKKYSL